MSRDDLLSTNVKIVGQVAEEVARFSPDAIMVVVSNPLDAMVYTAWKKSRFQPRRVLGMAGVLDTARFRSFLAEETGVSVEDVHALARETVHTYKLAEKGQTILVVKGFSTNPDENTPSVTVVTV